MHSFNRRLCHILQCFNLADCNTLRSFSSDIFGKVRMGAAIAGLPTEAAPAMEPPAGMVSLDMSTDEGIPAHAAIADPQPPNKLAEGRRDEQFAAQIVDCGTVDAVSGATPTYTARRTSLCDGSLSTSIKRVFAEVTRVMP